MKKPNCGAAWFVSDLVGNPEDRFSHDVAHVLKGGAMNRFTAFPSMPVMRGIVVFSVLYYT